MSTETAPAVRKALEHTVVNAFSDMAFVDVIPCTPGEVNTSHLLKIAFRGSEDGELVLYLSHESKQKIVENIYGEDWNNLDPSEIDDCLLELMNVIAGNFVQALYGTGNAHDISLPELVFDESMLGDAVSDDYYFDAEGELIKVSRRGVA